MNLTDNLVNTGKHNQVLNRSLAFLGGVTIGSVAALLFAPKKGSESRKQLMDKLNGITSRINNKMDMGEAQKTTMAALPVETTNRRATASRTRQNNNDVHSSKAQSMVGHLKHTKKDSSTDYVD